MAFFTSEKALIPILLSILLSIMLLLPNVASSTEEAVALMNWTPLSQIYSLEFSWGSSLNNTSPCAWLGVSCIDGSINRLNLSYMGVEGTLYNFSFSSFPNLMCIDLASNKLSGTIPPQIGSLSKLKYLDLSYNQFSGIIPPEIGLLVNLETLHLVGNQLNGSIPDEIGQLKSLYELALFTNFLEGEIPSSFRYLSNLSNLYLNDNKLSGSIPDEIGNLTNLVELYLDSNQFTGPIPSTFGKLTNLTILYLSDNHLSGSIPPEIGMLKSLVQLSLHTNTLTGPIPLSLSGLTSLNFLHLYTNQLSGPIPEELGNLQSLTELELSENQLTGSIPASLGLLTNLVILHLRDNQLSGPIPHELGNLKLFNLVLDRNQLSGKLPDQICHGGKLQNFTVNNNSLTGHLLNSLRNCTSLIRLRLNDNKLSGNISEIFGVYPTLDFIDISDNEFYGEISDSWGRCQQLTMLAIENNNISGNIPAAFANATQLHELYLSSNQLFGEIPREFGKLNKLLTLSLRENQFSGPIPQEIRSLNELLYLDLSSNRLSGRIPGAIGDRKQLTHLNLSRNQFGGEIPIQLAALKQLTELDLSHNSLTGVIPSQFASLESLTLVDISFNHLEGRLPNNRAFMNATAEELLGNQGLCGNVTGLQLCKDSSAELMHKPNKSHKLVLIIVLPLLVSVILLAAFISILIICQRRKRKTQPGNEGKKHESFFSVYSDARKETVLGLHIYHLGKRKLLGAKLTSSDKKNSSIMNDKEMGDDVHLFRYETVEAATDNFSSTNKLGEGGFGPVYKGKLPDGQEVAVKRLSTSSGQGVVEFKNEILLIAKLQHTNLVRLLGSCIKGDEKILVYEYMPNKSLDFFLFDSSKSGLLNWTDRFKIIEGIAQGLLYLHKYSRLKVIHRDLKASNILLDDNLNPKISDFGMARIFGMNQDEANTNRVVGTYGYMSPEYAIKGIVSTKTDVFSFGVLVLEIVTGKKNNSCFNLEHPLNLIGLAWKLWKEDRGLELMDPTLEGSYPEKEASRCIQVGLLCVQDQADDRPSMSDVISMLTKETKEVHTPKQPAFFIEIDKLKAVTAERFESASTNEITMSVIEPR